MSIIRRQKPKGYTVISNYMFTKDVLSLKAIGLFCYMVSRPDGWNFSERGLASQLKDGKASIASALKELKDKKYIKMEPHKQDSRGRMIGAAYYLYQIPYDVDRTSLAKAVFTGDSDKEFRIEKMTNFTMLSNYHLLDGMSLKAMGLLSYILNLPDDWQMFSIDFFQSKFADGRTAITSALKELQERNYIQIQQSRNKDGTLGKSIYTVYEYPYDLYGEGPASTELVEQETEDACFEPLKQKDVLPCPENPHTVNQAAEIQFTEKSVTENRATENQGAENQPHININKLNIKKTSIKKSSIISSSSNECETEEEKREKMKRKIKQTIGYDAIMDYNQHLEERMENDDISLEEFEKYYLNPRHVMSIINAMTDVYCSETTEIPINGTKTCSKYRIIENFESLELRDVRKLVHRLIEFQPRNVRAYILVMLNNYM